MRTILEKKKMASNKIKETNRMMKKNFSSF